MTFYKNPITSILILLTLSFTITSCSDDDSDVEDTTNEDRTSSYDVNIEGLGNFSEEGLELGNPDDTIILAGWQENPGFSTEKLTCSFDTEELFFEAVIMLQDGNPLPIGDGVHINENDAVTSSITFIDKPNNIAYLSESGSVSVSNLQIGPPQTNNPVVDGESSFANFNLSFSGTFDTVDPDTGEDVSRQITADIVAITAPNL